MRYRFISQQRAGHSVRRLCGLVGVSPSGYYRWRRQPVGVRARREEALLPVIRAAFASGRNDLLVAAIVLFALFLAFGIRNQVLNASESVRLGENLPRIEYPARWRVQNSEGALLHAVNAGSPSGFDTQLLVTNRALRSD